MINQFNYVEGDTLQTSIEVGSLPIDESEKIFSVHIGEVGKPPIINIEQVENSRFAIPVESINRLDPNKPYYIQHKIKLPDGRVFVYTSSLVIREKLEPDQ